MFHKFAHHSTVKESWVQSNRVYYIPLYSCTVLYRIYWTILLFFTVLYSAVLYSAVVYCFVLLYYSVQTCLCLVKIKSSPDQIWTNYGLQCLGQIKSSPDQILNNYRCLFGPNQVGSIPDICRWWNEIGSDLVRSEPDQKWTAGDVENTSVNGVEIKARGD